MISLMTPYNVRRKGEGRGQKEKKRVRVRVRRRRRRRRKEAINVKRNEKGKREGGEGIKEKMQLFESLNLWYWVGSTNLDITMSLGVVDCSQFCRTFAFLCV